VRRRLPTSIRPSLQCSVAHALGNVVKDFRASPLQHVCRLSREDVEQAQFPLAWLVRLPPMRREHSCFNGEGRESSWPSPLALTALAEMSSRRG
jgi:hypothetical protein